MRLGNSVEFPVAYLAAIAADIIPVPISAFLTEPEVARIGLPAAHRSRGRARASRRPARPVLPAKAMREMYGLTPAPYAMGEPDRPAYIIYTSGTSGHPRAVVHAHRTVWARRMMWEGWYGLLEQDRVLHAGAFNWTYTLGTALLDPWARGATALIPGHGVASEALGLLLKQHDATIFAAAPGVYRSLLKTELPRLERLRHGLSAGEKLPDATRSAWGKATGTLSMKPSACRNARPSYQARRPPQPREVRSAIRRGAAGWRCSASMDRSASGSLAFSASRSAILG
jgi:acyl-CoA synthetase (AMP-forming)/AMP-acid ligase II